MEFTDDERELLLADRRRTRLDLAGFFELTITEAEDDESANGAKLAMKLGGDAHAMRHAATPPEQR